MRQRIFVGLGIAAVSGSVALFAACGGGGSSADAGDDATTMNDAPANDVATPDTSTPMDAGTDSSPTMDAGPCVESEAGCQRCCQMLFPDAAAFVRADLVTCACTASTAACKMQNQCGNSLCNNKAPSPPCTACLEDPDAGDCLKQAGLACAGDPGCAGFIACESTCGDGG